MILETSRVLNMWRCWEDGMPGLGMEVPGSYTYLVLCLSSIWLFWVIAFYNYLVSELITWVLWAILVNCQTWGRSHGNFWFIARRREAQVTTWLCDWHLQAVGQSCENEPVTCEVCANYKQLLSEFSCIERHPAGVWKIGKLPGGGNTTHIWCKKYSVNSE